MIKHCCLVCCAICFLFIGNNTQADDIEPSLLHNAHDAEVMQQAARAFVRYIQSTIVTNKKALQKYMDSTVLLNGKAIPKEALGLQLDTVLNERVATCVAQSNVEEAIPMRCEAGFMVGYGCLWFFLKTIT
jgi:hypothetical protein